MTAEWHVPGDMMDRYVAGDLRPALVMSVEAHIAACGRCRTAVPREDAWLAASWERLRDEVTAPRPRPVERALTVLGMPGHLARLLTATAALNRAWLAAVALTLVSAAGLGRITEFGPQVMAVFLVAAPVLPLAGIALAYGPLVDPVHETQAATPMAGPRLLLLRAGAVLVVAIVLTGVVTPLLPGPPGRSVAWLLPALALSAGMLALNARGVPLMAAAALLGAGWVTGVVLVGRAAQDSFLPFAPAAQALYGLAAVALALYVRHWRAHLETGDSSWT